MDWLITQICVQMMETFCLHSLLCYISVPQYELHICGQHWAPLYTVPDLPQGTGTEIQVGFKSWEKKNNEGSITFIILNKFRQWFCTQNTITFYSFWGASPRPHTIEALVCCMLWFWYWGPWISGWPRESYQLRALAKVNLYI